MKTKNNTVFPQTVEIPEPLEIHPSVSPLAADLLMKTAKRLMIKPDHYNQGNFTGHHEKDCGTPCCILGHMAYCAGLKLPYDSEGITNAYPLGLTQRQYVAIFKLAHWPIIPEVNILNEVTAAEGIARINHFLATGE